MKLLLAAPVLLAVATSASAGNAWVLWSQETATRPDVLKEDEKAWHRMAGFDSKPACMSYASTKAGALARVLGAFDASTDKGHKVEVQRLGDDYLAVKSTFPGGQFDGLGMWTFYQCWPDTVDPRGPKGK
jgi:hypothetical protein